MALKLVKNDLGKMVAKVPGLGPKMVRDMCNTSVYHFKVINFAAEGFVDRGVDPWPARKGAYAATRAGSRLLVKTGRLRQGIRITRLSKLKGEIKDTVAYAKRHNEGLYKMPQRKFIGQSAQLDQKCMADIRAAAKKVFG